MKKRRMRKSWFKCPNCLNHDPRLDYSARNIGKVFYAYCNALGTTCKSYETIAELAHCDRNTAIKGVQQLVRAGYISYCNTKYFSKKKNKVLLGKNVYSVNLNLLNDGYTIFNRNIFEQGLTDAALVIFCEIIICAGNKNRSYPSHKDITEATGVGHSTVCAYLKRLKQLSCLLVQLCLKKNHAYAKNSYIFVTEQAKEAFPSCDNTTEQNNQDFWFKSKNRLGKVLAKVKRFLFGLGVVQNMGCYIRT